MKLIYNSLKHINPKIVGSIFMLTLGIAPATAQTITSDVAWDFATANAISVIPANPNVSVSSITQGNNNGTTTLLSTTSASSGYAGASGGNNAGAAARVGAINTAASGSAYFEVTFTPVGGVILNSISFGSRCTGTGPQAYSIRTSIDGYASNAAAGTLLNNSAWALNNANITAAGANGPITLRIYGHSGSGSPSANTANWRIDDVTINVTASSVPLPVNFSSLNAFRQKQGVLLQWSTATEKNVNHFEVERSDDGTSFKEIGNVSARNQAMGADYSYTDLSLSGAAVYYRLRSVDFDGRFVYSPVVVVKGSATTGAALETNLVRNTLSVSLPDKDAATRLYIVNLAGVIRQQYQVSNTAAVSMDISALPAGMYVLMVRGKSATESFKFVKQ